MPEPEDEPAPQIPRGTQRSHRTSKRSPERRQRQSMGPRAHRRVWSHQKEALSPMLLAHYDSSLPTRVTSDASQYGAGAVLEQLHGKEWKPVQFMSCRFSPTQQRYAMIEKEACAAMMACETDHKPSPCGQIINLSSPSWARSRSPTCLQ